MSETRPMLCMLAFVVGSAACSTLGGDGPPKPDPSAAVPSAPRGALGARAASALDAPEAGAASPNYSDPDDDADAGAPPPPLGDAGPRSEDAGGGVAL